MRGSGDVGAEVNQERVSEAGGVPYSVVRATQFVELLGYIADSVPYVFRYRAASVDLADAGQAAQVAQDLRILLGFIGEHMPRHGIEEALVCGAPESAEPWVDLLRDRFELPSRPLERLWTRKASGCRPFSEALCGFEPPTPSLPSRSGAGSAGKCGEPRPRRSRKSARSSEDE